MTVNVPVKWLVLHSRQADSAFDLGSRDDLPQLSSFLDLTRRADKASPPLAGPAPMNPAGSSLTVQHCVVRAPLQLSLAGELALNLNKVQYSKDPRSHQHR